MRQISKGLTVKKMAEILGITPPTLRGYIISGKCEFATAYKVPGHSRYSFVFYPEKVREYIGQNASVTAV